MSRNILNDLSGDITTNVYINTIDVFEGTLPVVVAQANPNEQVNISLKDINGFGGADKILVTNTSNDGLVWAEQSWKRIASSYLQPYNITDVVSIPPDSYIRFDTEPVSALGFELKHDETNNNFVFREKDGTQIYKYTPTVDIFNPSSFEFGESDNERIVLSANNLRLNNRGSVSFREDASNGTSQISVQAPASLTTSATVTLPSSNGTLALTTDNTGLIQSVSSPLAVSSNNLTLGTVPYNLGGTGLTSYTTGDILYSSATNTLAKRGIGSTGQVLKVSGGIPVWDDDNNTEYTAQTPISLVGTEFQLDTVPYNKGGTGLTSYTEGDLLYASADNVLAKLARGSSGDILRMNGTGTLPEWRSQYGATSPITLTGGTTFELGTVPYNLGGTGQTGYNQGDMLYASLNNNLTKINIGTTGQVLKVASGISIPEWADETDTTYTATSPIFLAGTDFRLTTIPILLGGTNIVSYTQGDILYCSSSTGQGTLSKLPIGTAGKVLKVSSGGIPEWGDDNDTQYTAQTPLSLVGTEFQLGTVPYNKGGTGLTSYTQGDLLYASADNVLSKLAHGTAGQVLKIDSAGELPEWGTLTGATPFTTSGNFIYPTDTNLRLLVGATANANDYKLLVNGDAYINGPTFVETSSDHAIRIIRSGFTGISWYDTEANAQGNTNRAGYIQCDTSNKDMYINATNDLQLTSTSGKVSVPSDYFGIGTTNPQYPLHVATTASSGSSSFSYAVLNDSSGGWSGGSNVTSFAVAGYFAGNIWINNYVFTSSDRRIKTNIEDVEGKTALEQISQIPCRYYEYIDQKYPIGKCGEKHIGFVAQELEPIVPMAVCGCNKNVIPNVYKNINCEWNGNIMSSNDLETVAGVKYQFFVSDLEDCSDEEKVELVGNEDNTFTFEKKYNNVFCYGYEVDDFNTVDYNKIYTLNVSATQELNKIVEEQQEKIKTLESELASIKEILARNNIV